MCRAICIEFRGQPWVSSPCSCEHTCAESGNLGCWFCLPSCLSRDCCHFAAMHARLAGLCASEDFLSLASFFLIGVLGLQCVLSQPPSHGFWGSEPKAACYASALTSEPSLPPRFLPFNLISFVFVYIV